MSAADPVAIARDLLRCRSVTPAEGGALGYLEGVLKGAGFAVHRMTFSAPGTAEVDNLYARIGSHAPHLVFAGHTDVVPTGEETAWTHPPFEGRIAEGMLYGRGAVDMKGAIACKVAAALDHLAAHGGRPKGSISFLITGDEEGRRDQRHREAAAMGGRARRTFRPLHPGRAGQPGGARRHHQARPARLAQRHAHRLGAAGPRRLSAACRQPDPRRWSS